MRGVLVGFLVIFGGLFEKERFDTNSLDTLFDFVPREKNFESNRICVAILNPRREKIQPGEIQ